jgi:hypothetical protein
MTMNRQTRPQNEKVLTLRRPDTCVGCSASLQAGTRAVWDAASRTVRCLPCVERQSPPRPEIAEPEPEPTPQASEPAPVSVVPPPRAAGASAQREYERRSQRREQRIRARHPRLGGLILALTNDPASTRVWAQGARGERAVASALEELIGEHIEVLHDRVMRRFDGRISSANIDHIAVAASGVWVIDAKTHHGALQVRRSGGLFGPRVERLYIAGRDKTALLEGLAKQLAAVTRELNAVGASIPVHGVLCFVGTELPWFGETIGEVPLVGRRGLAKLLKRAGEFVPEDRRAIAQFLATRFPPAG